MSSMLTEGKYHTLYLIAINRFRNMILLGLSKHPLSITDPKAEEHWSIDYDFHINCIWRFRQGSKIIAGYQDVYTEIDEDGNIIDDHETETSSDDEFVRKHTLFEKVIFGDIYPVLPLKLLEVNKNEVGDLKIVFEKGYCFEAFTTYPNEGYYDEEYEEWHFIDVLNGKHYSYPEEKNKKILLVDETNTELSQILELVLQEIMVDDITVFSAGLNPGAKVTDRVAAIGKEWYGMDLTSILHINHVCNLEEYDYIVPLGIILKEELCSSEKMVTIFQEYCSSGRESQNELYNMGCKICEAIGCDYNVNAYQHEKQKEQLEQMATLGKGIEIFYKRTSRKNPLKGEEEL